MKTYSKPFRSSAELVLQLNARGLDIEDGARAVHYIDHIGYYRLSAYMFPFLKEPKTEHRFKPGISFERVLRLYRFDKKFRVILFNEIEKIEVAFRSALVNVVSARLIKPRLLQVSRIFIISEVRTCCGISTGSMTATDADTKKRAAFRGLRAFSLQFSS